MTAQASIKPLNRKADCVLSEVLIDDNYVDIYYRVNRDEVFSFSSGHEDICEVEITKVMARNWDDYNKETNIYGEVEVPIGFFGKDKLIEAVITQE